MATEEALQSAISSAQVDGKEIKVAWTALKKVGVGIPQTYRFWIRILITCLFGLSLQVMAQQPANTYNVKTQGGATGNGTTNDTTVIQNTLNAAHTAGKGVYFPAGIYIMNGISIPDNTSIFGDKSGISLVKSVQPYKTVNMTGDDNDVGETIGNLRIEDMFFLNMRFSFQNNAMANLAMRRCVIATDKIAPDGQGWMMSEWDGDDMIVEDCIFLSGHETGEWLGGRIKAIKASKTKGMLIRRNIIGLDMGNLSWLATEWQGYANWSNAVGRLNQFKTEQNLPRRMGEMAGGIAIFDGTENVIDQNIIHLDFEANLAGGMSEDHLIYSLRETKIEITRNWLSGLPNTAGGGLKHRDTWGPGVIAANYLNDAPLLLYSYGDPNSVPIDYDYLYPFDNQLIFRNYLKVTQQRVLGNAITGGSSRYGFNFMSDDGNTGKQIDVAENLFDLAANCPNQWINLAQGKTTADGWRIYESNFHVRGVNSGDLVEITGRNQTPGAYTYYTARKRASASYLSDMNATMAKYEAMEIPYLNIPPYGTDPVVNTPPVFTSTPGAVPIVNSGQAYSYNITTTDADGQSLVISAVVRPSWLTFTSTGNGTAILTGTATNSAVVSYPVSLSVSDGIISKVQSFVITLNSAPTVTITNPATPSLSLPAGTALTIEGSVSDDGLPASPGNVIAAWSKFSGPGTVTFSSPSTVNTSASFSSAGIYVLRLTATDGSATVFRDLNVTVIAPPGFATWIGGFNVGSLNGAGDDPDHDGIPNLIEYALTGGDPAQGGMVTLPASSLTNAGGNSYLTLTIQKNTTATGITLIAETCSDLATWNSNNTVIVSETASTLVVRDAVPVSGSSTRFMRLKVTQP